MTGAGTGSNKSAAQALRDRLKAKVGAKRASEPVARAGSQQEPAADALQDDAAADSTGMDGATRRLQLGDNAETPSKRVKIESGVALASTSEDAEGFAAGAAAVVVKQTSEGQEVKAEAVTAFWAELGGGKPASTEVCEVTAAQPAALPPPDAIWRNLGDGASLS